MPHDKDYDFDLSQHYEALDTVAHESVEEGCRQVEKWGLQHHDHGYWLGILGEEFGEVAKAWIEEAPTEELRKELIQTAAVALSWVDCIDRGHQNPYATKKKEK